MKRFFYAILLTCIVWTSENFCPQSAFAQQDLWEEQQAWEGVPEYYQKWDYPDFKFPSSLSAWKKERLDVRATLLDLLGDIPARPKQLNVKTVFKKEMNGYTLEKFL